MAPNPVSRQNKAERVGEGGGWKPSIETGAMQGAPLQASLGASGPMLGLCQETHAPCSAASPTGIPFLKMSY